jgi:hypothetical protein
MNNVDKIVYVRLDTWYDIFRPYYPNYDPDNFGKKYCGEYEGWAPYKDFNRQIVEHFQKNNKIEVQK